MAKYKVDFWIMRENQSTAIVEANSEEEAIEKLKGWDYEDLYEDRHGYIVNCGGHSVTKLEDQE
jgi:hypothetical protein